MAETDQPHGAAYRNRFVDLKELVYAPLRAASESNRQLSVQLLDQIAGMGTVDENDPDKAVRLKTIKMAYEQIRGDGDDLKVIDEIALKVPLLSLIPLNQLQVAKTKVSFDAEVKSAHRDKKTGEYVLESRICAKRERRSDFIPRVSIEVEAEAVLPAEGLARFIDILNANPIPETMLTKHLDEDGGIPEAENQEYYRQKRKLKARRAKLSRAAGRLETLVERKKMEFSDMLQRVVAHQGKTYESVCCYAVGEENRGAVLALSGDHPLLGELPALYDCIQSYQERLVEFQQKIARVEEKLLLLEVEHADEA